MASDAPQSGIKSIENLVDAFVEDSSRSPELFRECLWRIVDLINEIAKAQKRTGLLAFSTALIFELINRSLVSEASLAGVKLARLDFITTAIPAIVAYFYLRFLLLNREGLVAQSVLFRLTKKGTPSLYESDIDQLLILDLRWISSSLPNRYLAPRARRRNDTIRSAELLIFGLSFTSFNVYAFWQIFAHGGFGNAFGWLSLLATSLLILIGIFHLLALANPMELSEDLVEKDI